MHWTKDALNTMQLRQVRQLLRALVGHTDKPTSLSDAEFDEVAEWQSLRQLGVGYPLLLFSWLKHMLLYLFGEYEDACQLGLEAVTWFSSAPGLPLQTHFTFTLCLSLLARDDKASPAEQKEYDAHIERLHKQLGVYSGHCAANYVDRERLIAAERARVAGRPTEAIRLYEEAIAAAHRNGFPLHEALALELAGRFHAAADRGKLATYYLTEALYAYLHIRAAAKASALLAAYPEPLRADTRALQRLGHSELLPHGTTSSGSHTADDRLDVNSVLRASEAISCERALDKAIDQILHTVLTSAGVQRGYLLLDRGGTLQLEASRTISPDSSRTSLGIPLDSLGQPGGASESLALSVVHDVIRTREVVTLSAGVPDPRFINVMPLIGTVDPDRTAQILEVALSGAQHSGAKVVILDITGLRHIDTNIADSLIKTARALRLLGSHAILTGIRAGVAQILVGLGIELSSLETRSTLQSAIAFALRYTGESLLIR